MLEYLSNRTSSYVRTNDQFSQVIEDYGIAQGAAISTLLFNIFLNDLPYPESVEIYAYADDLTIRSGVNIDNIKSIMQTYMNKVVKWLEEWEMISNEDKTNVHVYTQRRAVPVSLMLHNKILPQVKEQKHLGMIFHAPRLTCKSHIENTATNCKRRLDILKIRHQ